VERLAIRVASAVENRKKFVVLGFAAVFLTLCALLAATKLMWFDEFITYYPAKLPTFGAVWDAYAKGTDPHTPIASLFLKACTVLFGDNAVADRLPFSAFFLVLCVCIFQFVSKHCPAVYAGAAMIFPALTTAFYWATEIRGYAMVLGFTGLALLCWQQAGEQRGRVLAIGGLFLSLAGAICSHYYAAFLWIPFGLAELTRGWVRKRIDVPVWLALLLSPFPVLLFLPGIRAARAIYLSAFWARPYLGLVAITYDDLLRPAITPVLEGAILCILLAAFLRPAAAPQAPPQQPPLPDLVLAASLALLPVLAFPFTFPMGSYEPRFFLPLVAGVVILLTLSVARVVRGNLLIGTVLFLFLGATFVIDALMTVRLQMANNGGLRTPLGQPLQNSDWMRELESSALPIVASPSLWFPQLQYYAPDGVRSRIYYLADENLSAQYNGQTSLETNLRLYSARGMIPRVVRPADFLSSNPRFLLCVEENLPSPAWIVSALLHRQAALRLNLQSGPYRIYEVELPSPGERPRQ